MSSPGRKGAIGESANTDRECLPISQESGRPSALLPGWLSRPSSYRRSLAHSIPPGGARVAVTLLLALVGAIGQRWQSSRRSDSETDAADTGAKSPRQTLRGDRTLAFEIGAMVIVATLLVGVYFVFPHFLHKPKSVEDQINVKLRQFLNGGQDHVVVNERLQLHSGDDPSWVVVIENARNGSYFDIDTKAGRPPHSPNPVSDELRIYMSTRGGWISSLIIGQGAGASMREDG